MTLVARAVLLCDSIHDVLMAERAVKEAKLWCDMVPAPRELSSDCGMALAVQASDLDAARGAVANAKVRINAWYQQVEGSYHPV